MYGQKSSQYYKVIILQLNKQTNFKKFKKTLEKWEVIVSAL